MFKERGPLRLTEGWHKLKGWKGSYVRDLMGHHLVIFHGRTPNDPNWYKWVDGHFRGSVHKLADAKHELEQEAHGGTAWGSKLEHAGTHVAAGSTTSLVCGPLTTMDKCSSSVAVVKQPLSAMEELLKPASPEVMTLTMQNIMKEKGASDEANGTGVGAL